MNKFVRETGDFVNQLSDLLSEVPTVGSDYEVVIAPPSTHLVALSETMKNRHIGIGAQNCGFARFGAYTGETSPAVIKEIGGQWVVLGHSERRHIFKEDDSLVLSRMKAALEENLFVILCVGENLRDRDAGKTFETIEIQLSIFKQNQLPPDQLRNVVVAYEPVWAIGTGKTATPEQAQEVHHFIRNWFKEEIDAEFAEQLRILYGGSVKPDNSLQLMSQQDVDGFLVGGASLDPAQFANVVKNGLKSVQVRNQQ